MDVGAVYEAYHGQVFGYAFRKMNNVQAAEDITQTVFMRLVEANRNGQVWRGKLSSWLFQVAHNLMVDQLRAKDARHELLEERIPAEMGVTVEGIAQRQWLELAMRVLTPGQRRVIEMRFFEGMDTLDVAAELGVTREAVSALQFRGIAAMREVPGWQ